MMVTSTRTLPEHPGLLIKDTYHYNGGKWTYETKKPQSCISNRHRLHCQTTLENGTTLTVNLPTKWQPISDKSGTNNSRLKKTWNLQHSLLLWKTSHYISNRIFQHIRDTWLKNQQQPNTSLWSNIASMIINLKLQQTTILTIPASPGRPLEQSNIPTASTVKMNTDWAVWLHLFSNPVLASSASH
jgi:hypothetical protein